MNIPTFIPSFPLVRTRMCAAAPARETKSETGISVGMRVRVVKEIFMYHYPGKKNTEVNVQGFEGIVKKDVSMLDGVPITATSPYVVDFAEQHPKFKAHFAEDELEILE